MQKENQTKFQKQNKQKQSQKCWQPFPAEAEWRHNKNKEHVENSWSHKTARTDGNCSDEPRDDTEMKSFKKLS